MHFKYAIFSLSNPSLPACLVKLPGVFKGLLPQEGLHSFCICRSRKESRKGGEEEIRNFFSSGLTKGPFIFHWAPNCPSISVSWAACQIDYVRVRTNRAIACMHSCNGWEGRPRLTSRPPVTHWLLAIVSSSLFSGIPYHTMLTTSSSTCLVFLWTLNDHSSPEVPVQLSHTVSRESYWKFKFIKFTL